MWDEPRSYEEDHLATIPEAINEWAWNVGCYPRFIDCQWLNTDYDTWVKNPHYQGLDQRHPEDCGPDEDLLVFADGTPTSVYDDGNWKTTRADRPHRR